MMAFLAAAAPYMMVAGTALSVAAQIQQGRIAEANAKAQAANMEANAMARRRKAEEEARYYGQQMLKEKRAARAAESRALAAFAAGGVAPNAVVLSQLNQDAAAQIYEYQRAGAMAYRSGMWEADWMMKNAAFTGEIGGMERSAYTMSAVGTGMQGVYNYYSMKPSNGTTLTSGYKTTNAYKSYRPATGYGLQS